MCKSKNLLMLFYILIISLIAIQTYPTEVFANKESNKASNLEIDFVNPSDGSAKVPPNSIISVTRPLPKVDRLYLIKWKGVSCSEVNLTSPGQSRPGFFYQCQE